MGIECEIKSQLNVGGHQSATTGDGRIAEIKFSPQVKQPKFPPEECVLVNLLVAGGSKKRRPPLKGPVFSPCGRCGREIAVVASDVKR
jgi:hypothetical protein